MEVPILPPFHLFQELPPTGALALCRCMYRLNWIHSIPLGPDYFVAWIDNVQTCSGGGPALITLKFAFGPTMLSTLFHPFMYATTHALNWSQSVWTRHANEFYEITITEVSEDGDDGYTRHGLEAIWKSIQTQMGNPKFLAGQKSLFDGEAY